MRVVYRPIGYDWPGERTRAPKHTPFGRSYYSGSNWSDTLQTLDRELRALGAESVIFQLDMEEQDIRLDGMPKERARPKTDAVIISFESKHGPLRYFCDQYIGWKENVRAIALGLESLRRVERYGITHRGEQYTGFKALPPPSGEERGVVYRLNSPTDAARFMLGSAGLLKDVAEARVGLMAENLMHDKPYRDSVFKRAAQMTHPDHGGNLTNFDTLLEARKMLENAVLPA